jgi:hypothetical protein
MQPLKVPRPWAHLVHGEGRSFLTGLDKAGQNAMKRKLANGIENLPHPYLPVHQRSQHPGVTDLHVIGINHPLTPICQIYHIAGQPIRSYYYRT